MGVKLAPAEDAHRSQKQFFKLDYFLTIMMSMMPTTMVVSVMSSVSVSVVIVPISTIIPAIPLTVAIVISLVIPGVPVVRGIVGLVINNVGSWLHDHYSVRFRRSNSDSKMYLR
jgi:hypothetical protein